MWRERVKVRPCETKGAHSDLDKDPHRLGRYAFMTSKPHHTVTMEESRASK